MGDRELPVANRTVQKRWLRYTAAVHAENKSTTKTSIPLEPPPTYNFLSSRSKRNQVFLERNATIERENLILLDKMRHIMTERQMDPAEPFSKDSLNRGARKQEMIRIMAANESLLRRIQCRKPSYQVSEFEKEHAKKEYLLSRVGKFPYVSESVPDMTPPPIPSNKLVYYGPASRAAVYMAKQKRHQPNSPGLLPKLSGTQSARNAASTSSNQNSTTNLNGTTTSPAQPATSRPAAGGRGKQQKIQVFAETIDVEGVAVNLTVFEKPESSKCSAGLEFIGVTEDDSSTALPAFYAYTTLSEAFGARKKKPAAEEEEEGQQDKPDEESKDESKDTESARTIPQSYFNNPLQTRSLVRELISKLTWVDSGKEDGKRNLILAGVEQELRKPPPPKGALLYTRISVNARGLPKDKVQTNAPVAVLYAMNEETQQYQQIAHTPLVKPVTSTKATPTSSTASLPPTQEYAGNVIIPHYELIDGPLRMGIFEVDAQNNVIPTSCLGECKWMIQAMMSAKTGLKLKLLKNGRPIPHLRGEPEGLVFINSEPSSAEEAKKQSEAPPATAATKTKKTPKKKKEVEETKEAEASPSKDEESKEEEDEKAATSKKAEDEEESEAKTGSKDEEEDAADDEDDLSSSKKVKKLFQGGRNLQGVELLIRIVDGDDVPAKQRPKEVHEEHAILYQLYYRPSSLVFDHAIAKSALPDLLSQLVTPCDSDLLQDQVEALLELFTASKDGEDIKVLFQSKDLVSWKDLPASSSTEAKPKAVEDKAEPKASPAKAKPAPVNTEAASSPKTSPKTSPKSSPRAGLKKQASVEKPAKTEKKPLVDEKASVASKVDAFEKEAEKEQKEAAAEETKSDKEKKKAAASAEEDEEAKPSVQSTPAKKKSTDKVDSTPKVDKKKSVDAKIADKEKEKEQLTRTPSKKEIKKSPSTTKVGADKEKEKDKKKPVSAEKKEKGKEAEKPKAEEADKKPEPAEAKPSGKTSGDISETEQPKDGLDDLPDIGKDLDDESLPAIAKSDEKASTSRPKTAEKSAPASRPKTAEKTTPAPAAAAASAKEEEKNPAEAKPKSAEKRKTAEKPVGAAAASSEKRKTADKDTLPSDKEKTLLQKKSSVDGTREAKDEATLQTSPELTEELDADFADLIDVDEADKKQEEAEEKKKMDEEAAKKKKKADEEAAAKKKADEEAAAAKKKADEEAAAAKKKADEEAASASADADKKKGEEEEAAKKAAAEAKAKSDADDAAAVAEKAKAAEEEAAKKKEAHEKAAKEKADAEAKAKADKEAKEKAEKEAAEAKAKSDKEAADKKAAEEKAAKEKADREAAAKKAAEDKKKAEEAAAAAEAEKKKKAEDEAAAAAAKKKADDEAAAAATKKAEADKKAAEEAAKEEKRKKKAAEKEAARAKLEADAKEALAKGPTPVTFTMNITCKHLPIPAAHPDGLSPMVAMYAEAPDGQYGFVSQTERVDKNQSPSFSTQIVYETDQNTPAAALMFSIYHVVEGVALSEDDMVGQALSTQGDLMLALAGKKTLELPIQANGELVAKAHVTLTNLAMVPGHASKAAASGEDSSPKIPYEIYVSCKNLKRGADGNAVVSSMCALYQADENNEFAFLAQTERIEDNTNPIFETPIRLEASLVVDRHLMFSLYHVNEGAEISAEDQIGAATTTVHALIAATEAKPLKLQIVKDETTLEGAEIEAYAKKL